MSRTALRDLVERHATDEGITQTPIEGLQLFRASEPIDRTCGVYTPGIYCIVQGSKRAFLSGTEHVYDPRHYLISTMPLPVEAEIPRATADKPVLGAVVSIETRAMTETLVEYEAFAGPDRGTGTSELIPGLGAAPVDDTFATAVQRLLELLDDPVAVRVLSGGRLRELLFATLEGAAGALLRRSLTGARDVARALSYLHDNLREPVSVDDLARQAGMSRAVFHRRFKAVTTYSPLQFIKALRLSDAAMLIARGVGVSQAADQVGYTSASQFSREFRRQYGEAPKQWGQSAAAAMVDVQAIAP